MKEGLKTGAWSAVAKPGTYVPWISRPDTARGIATVATRKDIARRVLVFNHNVAITYAQVAEILSEVAGKKIEFKQKDIESFANFLRSVLPEPARNSAKITATVLSSYDLAAELGEYEVSNHIYEITGQAPESLRNYIKRTLSSAVSLDSQ